jgi:hypothetical protein
VEFCLHAPGYFNGASLCVKEQIFCYSTCAVSSIKQQEFWRKAKVNQQPNTSWRVKKNFKMPMLIQGYS